MKPTGKPNEPVRRIPPEQPNGKGLDETPCCARFSFVRVTTPGCEGTINLLWDEHPVAWINAVQIAREIMAEIPEHNA
jgi:hypothetical protein